MCTSTAGLQHADNLPAEPGQHNSELIVQEPVPAPTCTLWSGPGPRPVHGAVPAQHPCGVVAFPALVDNGAGEDQAVVKYNLRVAGGPRVSTGYN